ncbi:MAG TPA: hypothetical protein VGQ29_15065 [Gemmatimonadales bacterium]|nr:hypothetical protein [Gemmatimonadales bacterium]
MRREQHSRRADPALRRAVLNESLLEGRQPSAIGQSLDRGNLAALDLAYGYQATVHDLAVDEHRTGAAFPLAAPFLRTGEVEVLAQYVKQTTRTDDVE